MKTRFIRLVLCGLVLLVGSVGMISGCAKGEVPIIKLGYIHNDHQTSLYVAIDKWEYFKENSGTYLKPVSEDKTMLELWSNGQKLADVDLIRTKGATDFTTLMGQGHIDIGFTGAPAMVFAIDKGLEAKILHPVQKEGDALLVKPEIPITTWQDFVNFVKENENKPFRVGYKVPIAVAKTVFEGAMEAEGISYTEDVTKKNMDVLLINMKGNKNIIPGLESGVIDAAATNMPVPAVAESEGAGKIVTYLSTLPPEGEWIDHPCCTAMATNKLIEDQPEIVDRLVEVIIRAALWMEENPDEVPGIASDWLGTTVEVERVSLQCSKYTPHPTDAWQAGVLKYIDLMQELGEITGSLMGKTHSEISSLIFDFGPYERAMDEIAKSQ